MALSEEVVVDKIEIVGPYRDVQVRRATVVYKDDVELTRAFNRHVVHCQQTDASGDWEDTDVSGEAQEVQDVCNSGIWTNAIKAAYRAAYTPE